MANQPYIDDPAVKRYNAEMIKPAYAEAGKPLDDDYPVWTARAVYDHAVGHLSWPASCAKHLRECQGVLGIKPPAGPAVVIPTGRVQLVGGAFVDDRGPWNPIGASFFPAAWAWKFDRSRFLENVEFLAPFIDYVRIWGQVGGGPWVDRPTNPDWPDYEEVMAGTIDALYERGVRTQITILAGAGAEGAETPDRRRRLLDQTLAYLSGREQKIMFIEIANEKVGLEVPELRELARSFAPRTTIPVAITSIPQAPSDLYLGMRDVVDVATCHYDRGTDYADGFDRSTRQPWGYPGEYYDDASTAPQQAIDNEGVGPYSSVASDMDPLRNVSRRVVAWIAKNPASLWHAGPGIYFGGAGGGPSGSPANFPEIPGGAETLAGFGVIRKLVPPGISGWSRQNSRVQDWPNYPWEHRTGVGEGMFSTGEGCVRAYATIGGQQVVCVPFGIRKQVVMAERRPMDWTVYSLLTGDVLQAGSGTLTLPVEHGTAQLILGTLR
jgi:hypothetical protein